MASYTRQMIEAAQLWLRENPPETRDSMLSVPGSKARHDKARERQRVVDGLHARVSASPRARSDQSTLSTLAEIDKIVAATKVYDSDLDDAEAKIADMLNESVMAHHGKGRIDTSLHADKAHWLMRWSQDGYNTFDLSADFVAAMLLTDPTEIDISEVRLPFGAVLFLLPDGFARGADGRCYTKVHVVETVSDELARLRLTPPIAEAAASLEQDQLQAVLDKITSDLHQHGGVLPTKSLLGPPRRTSLHGAPREGMLQIQATDGVYALDTWVNREGLSWETLEDLPSNLTDEADRDAIAAVQRIVFGTLAFCTAVSGAKERRPTPKPHRKAARQEPAPAMWDVGRTIRLSPDLVRAARGGSREVALRIKHRHIVRGHYRNQPIGPGRQDRKRIWIAPFWKGPEDGAALIHTYKPSTNP